jgi:hypothetical protein
MSGCGACGCTARFYALTATCERPDVIAEPVSGLAGTAFTRRILVFDKDDLSQVIPSPSDPPPDAGTITYLIEETLRQAANFPSWSCAATG